MSATPTPKVMSTSDRFVALLIAIVSVLMVIGFQQVIPSRAWHGPASVVDSRGEPFP